MRAFLQPLRAASARHQLTLARKPLAAVVVSSRSYSAEEKSAKFYKTETSVFDAKQGIIRGETIDNAVDLKKVRPGDVVEVPYELTVSSAFRDFWQSAFYSHDRINTSTPFARSLGLQDQPIPFSMMLYLAASMSHADEAKIETSFSNAKYVPVSVSTSVSFLTHSHTNPSLAHLLSPSLAHNAVLFSSSALFLFRRRYHWPAFSGDTFKKRFVIEKLRNTSDGHNSIIDVYCEIINPRDVLVFSVSKQMMFPFVVPASEVRACGRL